MLTKKKKAKVIKDVQQHAKDTGSADVQIGILSKQIEDLTKHLKKNPNDGHSRRGLLKMVADRQSMLKYLAKKNPKRHKALLKKIEA